MYMAETLMRMKKDDNVCLFEKDSSMLEDKTITSSLALSH